jgi:NAD-dependent deacetylase
MFNSWFDKNRLKQISKLLQSQKEKLPIVILTGSGISAESGIQTFRGQGGLWNGVRIEEVCRPEGFARDPETVINFYNQRRADLNNPQVKPNLAHFALAKLEQELKDVYIITQNVDDLHERSGSKNVYHIHGQLFKNKCDGCLNKTNSQDPIPFPNQCSKCGEANLLRPDVVFFKEFPYHMRESEILLNNSKIFISIGTSGLVYPAAGFVRNAKNKGALCMEINPHATDNNKQFNLSVKRKAGESLPEICDELIRIIQKA